MALKDSKSTTTPGFINVNKQLVLRRTTREGNLPGQRVYALHCQHCDAEYGANGCDIHIRRCPKCQGGATGLGLA
jgi:hypothetical protein